MAPASGTHTAMRGAERLLLAIAALALVWYATIRIDAAREQAALSNELTQSRLALASSAWSRHHDGARTGAVTTPSPRGLVP